MNKWHSLQESLSLSLAGTQHNGLSQGPSAESIPLHSLVHHAETIPHDLNLEETSRVFREKRVSHLALTTEGTVTGICSAQNVGMILGARFGFALHAKSPASMAQVQKPLIFPLGTPIRTVLAQALCRHAEAFHEDVAIVDEKSSLVGMVPTEYLAHVQTRLVEEQVTALRRQNLDILRSSTELGQARGLWQALFDSSILGVALCDERGAFKAINRRASQLLNVQGLWGAPDSLIGLLPERSGRALASLLPDPRPGETRRCEHVLSLPGRGERLFHLDTTWIEETQQYCICLDDITDQRALEMRMKQKEKELLFDTLVAGIAHELNNKMTPAIGFSDLLEDLVPSGEGRGFLECIRNSVTEAAQIVKQLLQLSRPEAARFTRVDLCALARESLLMLQFQIKDRGVRVLHQLPPSSVYVHADAGMLKQVVINLAINSLHAIEGAKDAQILIEVSHGKAGPILSVTDNGCGIPKEMLGRIFDPFFTTKAPDRGTGLGLSVCLSIMRQHGGGITVRSEPGQGSTFSLCLPLYSEDDASAKPGEFPARRSSDSGVPLPHHANEKGRARLRILAVDDEENVRAILHELLTRCFDCHIEMAVNGAHALRLASAADYDLIISDVRMPEMDGLSFYRQLLTTKPQLCSNFILCSGYAGDAEMEKEIISLGIPLLRKPFNARQLFELGRQRVAGSQ